MTPPEPLPTPAAPLARANAPKRPHATYERGLWWLMAAAGLVLMISSTAATVDWFLLDAMAPRAAFRAVRTATHGLGLVVVVFQIAGLWCLRGQKRVRSLVFATMATLGLLRAAGPLLDVAGWAGSVGAILVMQALGLLARACLVAVLLRLAAGRLPGVLHALHAISAVAPTFAILLLSIVVRNDAYVGTFPWGTLAFATSAMNLILVLVIAAGLRRLPPPPP